MQRRLVHTLLACILMLLIAPATALASTLAPSSYAYEQTSATSATIVFEQPVEALELDDPTLASAQVEADGVTVDVVAAQDAVGVVGLQATCDDERYRIEVPLGYTTFAFDGDAITVYPGSSSAYEISGICAPKGTVPSDAVEATASEDGSVTYRNGAFEGAEYALVIEIGKAGGTFVFTGAADNASVAIKKAATGDANLLLAGLDLHSELTAPVVVKKDVEGEVSLVALAGHRNRLSDGVANNADITGDVESGGDASNVGNAESAVIKGKAGAHVTLCGTGSLALECASKNAAKLGAGGVLTVRDLTLDVNSARHGLSCDNVLVIESGTLAFVTMKDAIRSDPDEVDAEAGCAGDIFIRGGQVTIDSHDDAVHAANLLVMGEQGAPDDALVFTITDCLEGLEARNVEIRSGVIDIMASDDGINTVVRGMKVTDEAPDCGVVISGGRVNIDVRLGDGIDSNGTIVVTGGYTVVCGGKMTLENGLDSNGAFVMTGGTLYYQGYDRLENARPAEGSQPWVASKLTVLPNYTVVVKVGDEEVFSHVSPRATGFAFFSSPTLDVESTSFTLIAPPDPEFVRICGESYANETAAAISEATFGAGSEWVVIARDDDFADALGAAGLAGVLDAPILLTGRGALSEAAAAEIVRLGATHAYVIGGTGAISPQVDADLAELGVAVEPRVAGENSYDTSLACAKLIVALGGDERQAIVVMSTNFQDALSMSPYAYRYHVPIVLQTWGATSADRGLTDEAHEWLQGKLLLVAGGTGAVSAESLSGLALPMRLYGETGYETSNEIARWMVANGYLSPENCVIASGAQAAKGTDALAGAALAGKLGVPLILVSANEELEPLDMTVMDGYFNKYKSSIRTAYILGGTYVIPSV